MTKNCSDTVSPIVHIGYQKTATTYLQTKVFARSSLFQQPWGVQPPKAIEHFVLEHPYDFDPVQVRRDFSQALMPDSEAIPVISHEDLSGYPVYGNYYADRVAYRLHQTFPELRLIVGIRNQASMIRSQYFQYVRQGGTESIDALLNSGAGREGFRPTLRLEHFEYDKLVRHFSSFFPLERILVLPLEMLQRDPEGYAQRLMRFCGTSEEESFERDAVLKRRADVLMRLERRLNHVAPPPKVFPKRYKDAPLPYRAKERFLRVMERIVQRSQMLKQPDSRVAEAISRATQGRYGRSNARLSELTGLNLAALGYDVDSNDAIDGNAAHQSHPITSSTP